MISFLYTAQSRTGRRLAGRILAAEQAAARAQLESEGLRDIVFEQEQWDAKAHGVMFKSLPNLEVTPDEEVRIRHGGNRSAAWLMLRSHSWALLPLLAWSSWAVFRGRPFDSLDYAGFTLTLGYVAWIAWLSAPVLLYNRLLHAQVWARWDEALKLSRWLRVFHGRAKLAPHAFDYYDAKSLIGKGEIQRGLAQFARWESRSQMPPVMFAGLMAALRHTARDYSGAIKWHRIALELEPNSAQTLVDLALALLRHGDPREAAPLIERAERLEQRPFVRIAMKYASGLLHAFQGRDVEAVSVFSDVALEIAAASGTALGLEWQAEVQGFCAISLARLGHRREAERTWRSVLPMFHANRREDLFARFAEACARTT